MRKCADLIGPVLIVLLVFILTSCAAKNPRDLSLKDIPKSEDIENAKDVVSKNKDILKDQSGSSKTEENPPEAIPYIKNGINIHLKGDKNLNWYRKTPHALILCVYQLKDLSGFNQLVEDKNGMAKLMECSRFDSSVSYVKRVVVQPNKDVYESMELVEGTSNVGIIAGYYFFKKSQAIKTFVLPMKGFFKSKPSGTDINLDLKSYEIQIVNKED